MKDERQRKRVSPKPVSYTSHHIRLLFAYLGEENILERQENFNIRREKLYARFGGRVQSPTFPWKRIYWKDWKILMFERYG